MRSHAVCLQTSHRLQQEMEAEVQRAIRESIATIEASDSDEEELPAGEASASDEDEKKQPNTENIAQWTQQLHDLRPPLCTTSPTVVLPRHRPSTELDSLQYFLHSTLIDTFVTNTNLYATSRQAAAWVPTTTEEMWRYLAIRIRQGIVVLPELHHYWEAGYRDPYTAQLMSRNRFCEVHRYFHITYPVPRGQRQTVVEKTDPFYHQCQALLHQFFVPGSNLTVDETMIRFQGRSH